MISILECCNSLERLFNKRGADNLEVSKIVSSIIKDVKENGDEALFRLSKRFDKFNLDKENIRLTNSEIERAYSSVPDNLIQAIKNAKANIEKYHKKQIKKSCVCKFRKTGVIFRPVTSAGIYVPGGRSPYPSTVLMCALPAKLAGVERVVMVTPASEFLSDLTIAAAHICGVDEIYRVGGAGGIAALAYGTESIKRVDIIVGPGNAFVTEAKKQVFGTVGIDMLAGPSEILIIADSTAKPDFVAADMLSQAEHDELSQSVLLCFSFSFASDVKKELERQIEKLAKKEIAKKAIENFGTIVVCNNLQGAIELSNKIAPEHLQLCIENPFSALKYIRNAGAIFMGNFSPEPLGDYYAGTNHVLPTNNTATFSECLSVDTFTKRISVVNYSRGDLQKASRDILALAQEEGFTAHANSIKIRGEKL